MVSRHYIFQAVAVNYLSRWGPAHRQVLAALIPDPPASLTWRHLQGVLSVRCTVPSHLGDVTSWLCPGASPPESRSRDGFVGRWSSCEEEERDWGGQRRGWGLEDSLKTPEHQECFSLELLGDGFNPWVGRSPGEGNGYPLQYSGLENSTDCVVHGVAKSRTWLSDFHFHYNISEAFK